MKLVLALPLCLTLSAGPVLAAGEHQGGHGHAGDAVGDGHHEMMAVGEPGIASEVTREVQIVMSESDSGDMLFEPSHLDVSEGETIRFLLTNAGELEHEFVLDEHHKIIEHKALMERFPEMEHDDPNAIRLEPGEKGTILWRFTNGGDFHFACLIPGHYELGMKGTLDVSNR